MKSGLNRDSDNPIQSMEETGSQEGESRHLAIPEEKSQPLPPRCSHRHHIKPQRHLMPLYQVRLPLEDLRHSVRHGCFGLLITLLFN